MKTNLEIFPILIQKVKLEAVSSRHLTEIVHSIDQEKLENNKLIKNGHRSKTNTFLDRKLWLKEIFEKEIDEYIDILGLTPAKISYSWCNKYVTKGFISPHKHEMSVISGVYYPLIRGENSYLKFRNPCGPFKINEVSTKATEFNIQEIEIPIEENMLIMFPSWIEHYSENYSEIKYAISFDTEIKQCLG
jgi:uncharacterized protein (TIGR02466 family)